MTTTASIVTRVAANALFVPNAALKTDDNGASYVQVLEPGKTSPTDVPVTVGSVSDTNTEILHGLNGGEKVVTQTITSSSGTAGQASGLSTIGGASRAVNGALGQGK